MEKTYQIWKRALNQCGAHTSSDCPSRPKARRGLQYARSSTGGKFFAVIDANGLDLIRRHAFWLSQDAPWPAAEGQNNHRRLRYRARPVIDIKVMLVRALYIVNPFMSLLMVLRAGKFADRPSRHSGKDIVGSYAARPEKSAVSCRSTDDHL